MLGTIKVPISLKLIGENLPKSQYDEDKKKEREKRNSDIKLAQIQEEENEEPIIVNQRGSQDLPGDTPSQAQVPRRQHRHPKVKNDIFSKK